VPPSRAGALVASAVAALLLVGCAATRPTGSPVTPPPTRRPATAAPPTEPPLPPGVEKTTGTKAVALTFDDGPDPRYTVNLLKMLHKHGVKATFCLVGTRVRAYPQIVRRIVAEGHTVCNHSWRHLRYLGKQPESVIRDDLRRTNEAIARAAPGVKIKYFRAPYGLVSRRLAQVSQSMGMTPIHWSVDPADWDSARFGHGPAMINHIVEVIRHGTRRGSIILAHDLRTPDTIRAFDAVLPWLKAHFKLEPLPV
jgi:peptidoglycan/xylan/chitin deacetylase (PgdA/CDA1 family)